MGVFDKIKTMFTEEIEEEVKPIRKEVIQVEIPSPTVALEKETLRENEEIKKEEKREEKFVFPVFFDDSDFETLEKPKEKQTPTQTLKYNASENYKKTKVQEKDDKKDKQSKLFKPTPIISPVYGVLDKNYHKEDITTKQDAKVIKTDDKKDNVTIDDIRKKAFGTLEDVLENTLFGKIIFDDVDPKKEEKKEEKDIFSDLEQLESRVALNKDKHTTLNDQNTTDQSVPTRSLIGKSIYEEEDDYLNDDYLDEDDFDNNLVEKELNQKYENEDLVQSDLFNLIDSMYEKGDE